MKRRAASTKAPSYPDLQQVSRTALVVGAAFTLSGCWFFRTQGDIAWVDTGDTADTGEPIGVSDVRIPESGSANLSFTDPWGWMDFHVVVRTDDEVFESWTEELPTDALTAVVDVLAAHAVTDFDPDHVTDLSEIEAALGEALAASAGAPSSAVQAVTLSIDAYEDENDIDGDMP